MDLQDRIYILDGATGTALQQFWLTETDFRGEEFAQHPIPLKGNNDVLNITRPDVIRQVHQNYIDAGRFIGRISKQEPILSKPTLSMPMLFHKPNMVVQHGWNALTWKAPVWQKKPHLLVKNGKFTWLEVSDQPINP